MDLLVVDKLLRNIYNCVVVNNCIDVKAKWWFSVAKLFELRFYNI